MRHDCHTSFGDARANAASLREASIMIMSDLFLKIILASLSLIFLFLVEDQVFS